MNKSHILPITVGFLLIGVGGILFVFEPLILNNLLKVEDFEGAHTKLLITTIVSILLGIIWLSIWFYKEIFSNKDI